MSNPARSRRILIAFASRHGSTAEIAAAVGRRLDEAGFATTVRSADLVSGLSGFDAVVVGSAVYMGRWLSAARNLIESHAPELRGLPTWLFSSGPIGSPARPEADSGDGDTFAAEIAAVGYHRFNGRLDRKLLSFTERATTRLVGAEEGDFRDWDDIRLWADGIAAHLVAARAPA